jgi:outer membrane protein assembly factor BamD
MVEGNYTRAIKLYEQLEARFPYGRYAQQAMLESAYANYRAGETAAAVAAAERFIRTYPNHPNVDYEYYLKGLVYFREDQGLLGYVYELDLSEREPKAMRESFAAFRGARREVPGQPLCRRRH